MNCYSAVEKRITNPEQADTFCKKRLDEKTKNRKCLTFFESLDQDNLIERCPFGLCAVKADDLILCGFACPEVSDQVQIASKRKHGSFAKAQSFETSEVEKTVHAVKMKNSFDVYSYFAHDIAHEISVLKTHIEELVPFADKYPDVGQMISLSQRLLAVYENYKSQRLESPSFHDNWLFDLALLEQSISIMQRKIEQYVSLIERFKQCLGEMSKFAEPRIDNIKILDCDSKTRHNVLSLFMMHSLFSYRIQYTEESLNLKREIKKRKRGLHSIHLQNSIYKLIMFLKPEVKRQGLRDIYLDGGSGLVVNAADSIYLVFHILLENAVKYAIQDTAVRTIIRDSKNGQIVVSIENNSDYISPESMKRIEEAGFSGENSINKDSHGFGLAIVKNILKESGAKAHYSFDHNRSVFIADVVFQTNNHQFSLTGVD